MVIAEPKEFLPHELYAVVGYDGVWDSKSVDDVREEQHGLLGCNIPAQGLTGLIECSYQ